MMDRIDWEFAKGDDITPIVNNMIESIMEIGISYIDYISDRKKILFQKWKIEKLENQYLIKHCRLHIIWKGEKTSLYGD